MCEIYVSQFNKLRDSYKDIYQALEEKVDSEILNEVKWKCKRLELDPKLFAGADSDVEDSSSSEEETNSDSDTSESSSETLHSPNIDSTLINKSNRLIGTKSKEVYTSYSITGDTEDTHHSQRQTEFDENALNKMYRTQNIRLKHLVLREGASKGISMTPLGITHTIKEEKNKLSMNIQDLIESYLKLVKLNPFVIKECLEAKYFAHFAKMVKKRTILREVEEINEEIPNKRLEREEARAKAQRRKYYSFEYTDTAR